MLFHVFHQRILNIPVSNIIHKSLLNEKKLKHE